jgi:hypothetical protein
MNRNTAVEDLGWMAGTWTCPKWGGTFEEHWLAPAGGTMQGCGRLVSGDKTGFMEFMSIELSEGSPTMWMLLGTPSNGEKNGVPFRLSTFDGTTALFENPSNGFPSKIAYVKEEGGMSCWISGVQEGKVTTEAFPFTRSQL